MRWDEVLAEYFSASYKLIKLIWGFHRKFDNFVSYFLFLFLFFVLIILDILICYFFNINFYIFFIYFFKFYNNFISFHIIYVRNTYTTDTTL